MFLVIGGGALFMLPDRQGNLLGKKAPSNGIRSLKTRCLVDIECFGTTAHQKRRPLRAQTKLTTDQSSRASPLHESDLRSHK